MSRFLSVFGLLALSVFAVVPAYAAKPAPAPVAAPTAAPAPAPLPERSMGKADAPITVDEFVSLTCSHCAEFYNHTLPEIEKHYIDTGKVRFVFHDFILDGVGLRAAQVARCMPEEQFFPFIKMLYNNQAEWATNTNPGGVLSSYAKLGGLPEDKAKECLADSKLQDSIVAERDNATQQYKIEATPTFVINNGAQILRGAAPLDDFAKAFDIILATKK